MKVVNVVDVLSRGTFAQSDDWKKLQLEVVDAAKKIVWPIGNSVFSINPVKKGNGVIPIKERFLDELDAHLHWTTERKRKRLLLQLDAISEFTAGCVGLEWETGNISSSHRAINRLMLGIHQKQLIGGILLVPSRNLYQYLTDRIGNFDELEQYIPLWQQFPFPEAVFQIVVFEQDENDTTIPFIPKITAGRANI